MFAKSFLAAAAVGLLATAGTTATVTTPVPPVESCMVASGATIGFTIDTSGSIQPNNFNTLVAAVADFIKMTSGTANGGSANDNVYYANLFNKQVRRRTPFKKNEGDEIADWVANWTRLGGGTDIAEGVEDVCNKFTENQVTSGTVILFTDGKSNKQKAKDAAKKVKDAGYQMMTVGIDNGVDVDLLKEMASEVSGSPLFFQEAFSEIADALETEILENIDTDSDGTPDCDDDCPSDAGKTEPGVCGCGKADEDRDGNGTIDCNETCGVPGKVCCYPPLTPNQPFCKQSDNYCVDSVCKVPVCGGPGQKCCPLDYAAKDPCQGDHECKSGYCKQKEQCGIWDKRPCPTTDPDDNGCETGLVVNKRGLCDMPCGAEGKMCCNDGSPKCNTGGEHPLTCGNQGKCVKCGGLGERVCNGVPNVPACGEWLIPVGNRCKRCGMNNKKCCDQGRPQTPRACKGKKKTCYQGTCKRCGMRHGDPICNNWFYTNEWCHPSLMRMSGKCMTPMPNSD